MSLNLANYEIKAKAAVKLFWASRAAARDRQVITGKMDRGERGAVTGGKNMDGFVRLASDIVVANGLKGAEIHLQRKTLTLPGYFRPTKIWDILVFYRGQFIAAMELKSQVGPSFGNNFNNRAEEAMGSAVDFWTAYRENAFGDIPRPFLGWLMLVEDAPGSRSPVSDSSSHFPVFPEFSGASYLERYHLLCKKLMQEQLYSAATILASPCTSVKSGAFTTQEDQTSLNQFLASFAGHIAAVAATR